MKKIKLTIDGMHCASCAANIERALGKVKGIKSASVSVMTKKALIEAEDNVNIEEIKKAVSNVGYSIVNIQ
ncbi:putative copper-exporting P-type ATPase A [uncultured archaeon]|nr:putative copper-exporting P-type ATPase A [uncultured archaeon]